LRNGAARREQAAPLRVKTRAGRFGLGRGSRLENIIEELIKIENKANAVMEQADEEAKRLDRRIEEGRRLIDAEMEKYVAERMKMIEDQIMGEADAAITQVSKDSQVKFSDIENIYYQTHEQLEEEIFRRIIGG
jgi:hypothetical protein